MIALMIESEEELKAVKKDMKIDESSIKIPGLYYEHLNTWCARNLYDAKMLRDFGYIIAKPVMGDIHIRQ